MTVETTLDCPKCHQPMRKLKLDECVVDRCEKCYGIWLDAGERLKLIARGDVAEVVDIGDAEMGHEQDKITEICCPRDGTEMRHREHPDQRHVTFEECPKCGGSFFDAGELRDLSRLSILDALKSLFRGR